MDLFKFWKHFKVKKTLGEGGFGKVYLAIRRSDQKTLAVKKVKKSRVRSMVESSSGVIPMELYCLQRLRHDHIVEVHGYLETGLHWMIVMEQCPMDLFEYVELRGRLCEAMCRHYYLQVQSAVTYCLSQGVDHRDIKDENILINSVTQTVKLTDFGAASLYHKDMPYTTGQGTEVFFPPEFLRRGYYYPIDGTVWALGCLAYKMVMGHYPFQDSHQIQNQEPRIAKVSPMCRSFIRSSLSKDPSQRLQYREILQHNWFSVDKRHF